MPSIIAGHKDQTTTMSIQMLWTSTHDNVRFIIIDIGDLTTMRETLIPTTPTQPRITRIRTDDRTPESSTPFQHVARTLTYDTGKNTYTKIKS